jgi:hypothetical protein
MQEMFPKVSMFARPRVAAMGDLEVIRYYKYLEVCGPEDQKAFPSGIFYLLGLLI